MLYSLKEKSFKNESQSGNAKVVSSSYLKFSQSFTRSLNVSLLNQRLYNPEKSDKALS